MATQSLVNSDAPVWFNGELIASKEAKVHILTHSLHYGGAVFEGERVYNGKVFKLTEHNERLHRSAEILAYQLQYSIEELDNATRQVVEANGITNGYVRPIAWRGSESLGLSASGTSTHVAIATFEWGNYYSKEVRERGLRLQTSNWMRPSPETAPSLSKAAGLYMICTLSRDAANANGFDDAFMLDYRGLVAEASAANVFFVFDGEVHTPTPDCFLDGITRQTAMDLARARELKVIERQIHPDEIEKASEVFLTGTAVEITGVSEIDDRRFELGPITKQLAADFARLVVARG